MSKYYRLYSDAVKKNFMLVIIALMLLFPTFFIWAGVPVFFVGNALENIIANKYVIYLGISLSGGLLFSVYFLPVNLKVARNIADERNSSFLQEFFLLEIKWILAAALIWGLGMGILFQ